MDFRKSFGGGMALQQPSMQFNYPPPLPET